MFVVKGFITMGISSITRPSGKNYLAETIKRLLDVLSEEESKEVFMVIFVADSDETAKSTTLAELSTGFKKYIDQGLLHVIFAPRDYYPPLSNLKAKFGDSVQRIFWRSKLVVDFTFLMCYCKDLSKYYLHLEDDLIPAPSYYPKLVEFITSQKKPWPVLDPAYMGHTAKVYHSSDLENIATYFYLLYDEMPVDWLIIYWRKIKYHDNFILPPASLFQHIGDNSSLSENKISHKSKEAYFDLYDIKYKGLNPSAIISSSITSYTSGTKPEHAYNKGSGYFWAKDIRKEDFILINFMRTTAVREVFVDTGSNLAFGDKLKSGVLQASFGSNSNGMVVNGAGNLCKDFETIADFKNGVAKVTWNERRKLSCFRILVTGEQREWLFIREIDVL